MYEELRELLPNMNTSPSLIRTEFQALVDTGYFTVNRKMFSFHEDGWNLSDSIRPELRNDVYVTLDFSKVNNEDIKLKLKLWVYTLLNPYKTTGTNKMKTIKEKLVKLIKIYSFMESAGYDSSFAHPNVYEVESIRGFFRERYAYKGQQRHCNIYIDFLEFVEEVWKIPQERDSIDVLKNFDIKKIKAETKANITDSIPHEYFQRLYDLCKKCMLDETLDINYRITSAVIILFSQTGLRRNELFSIEAQPVNETTVEDKFGRNVDVKYVYAKITKCVRGSDTKFVNEEIPLTEDGEAAFNMLMNLCKKRRKELKWNKLIVYPDKRTEKISRNLLYEGWLFRFYTRYHKELDSINTQDKYPSLASRSINILKGKVFEDVVEEFGRDAVLVYPTPTHFRKTFGTILYSNGVPMEVIARLLHHKDIRVTETHYVRPLFNQKDYVKSQETYSSIIKHDANVLGKSSTDFKKRLKECLDEEDLANICQSDEELIEYMSNNHPLHAKEVGFCLMSDIHPCTVRTDEERLLCAFNTCPNIGFLFYDLAEHYKQMQSHKKAMEINRQQGFELAAQKEGNCMKYLAKTFIVPEIEETKLEIQKHGKEQIIEWYPAMKPILEAFEDIETEVMSFVKEVVA